MYVDDVLDWIKIIFISLAMLLGLVIVGFLGWRVILDLKLQNEADSIKNKLEIENLELENKLLELQLKELGFNFTEESKQIEEE